MTGWSSALRQAGCCLYNAYSVVYVYVCTWKRAHVSEKYACENVHVCPPFCRRQAVCVHMLFSSQETCNLKRWDGGISSPHAVAGDGDTWAGWPQTISERERDGRGRERGRGRTAQRWNTDAARRNECALNRGREGQGRRRACEQTVKDVF